MDATREKTGIPNIAVSQILTKKKQRAMMGAKGSDYSR
ncbi:hypothetical protein AB434_0646 [Heyndrickxia coagulans]|uniref:Uncharacterized protein n=1 Tax=Heyndrickxia coagulans TaxID=1398 RepID=A0AAN0WA28_HEYCO|nr:hypothetical protein SB48_HM08orf00799 [Heyndrickxia coagulans]AKN53051.1 hypothetical protein AB434_0646 [Heyndrickxia coagulans]KYC78551.1 hypothetical protein B4096_1783 [Heyndrickxia coagulans]